MDKEEIKRLIEEGLPGAEAIVKGDDGAHFEAVVISPEFAGKSVVQQHQLVYRTLGDRMQTGVIHALALKTVTPEEWAGQAAG
ncbi:MAG TPA: BolA family transcriptional regulator [Thiotrichales bacterium]|nr:BolA family transcriptional regulator [Thiotrichales bacterium]